jgi:predicted dehydrogenase
VPLPGVDQRGVDLVREHPAAMAVHDVSELGHLVGAVGHLTSSYDVERGHPMERCEVAGTRGRLVVDDMWREATLYPAGDLEKHVYTNPVFGGFRDFDDTFRDRIDSFVRQVTDGVPLAEIDGSGAEGLAATRVIHAAIASLQTGLPVAVDDVTE